MTPALIFCRGNNAEMMRVARECGWEAGSRSDCALSEWHRPLALLDIHWTDYDWGRHLEVARVEQPHLAAVPDLEREENLERTLEMAEEIAPHCESVLVVPKVHDIIERLPREIGGTPITLGYSVPTKYGGTSVLCWEFGGWPVHLLGGSPRNQAQVARYLAPISLDGNVTGRAAVEFARSYRTDGKRGEQFPGEPLKALHCSLENLRVFWESV